MRINSVGHRSDGRSARSRWTWLGATLAVAAASIVSISAGSAPVALANTWPTPGFVQPATVTADVLPTVQINGVVWAQAVVGNTVYVGGNFTSARPAGSPAGTNEVPRSNFLAYDLTTGALLTSVVLDANAQVRTIEATPDGSRIYVGGDFTTFGGQTRSRIAAVNTATNTLVGNFTPSVGYHVYDISPTATTVYVAGNFLNVGAQLRERLAAFSTTGTLLSWAPSVPDREVAAIRVSPDGTKVAIGGKFETVNGTNTFGRGLAMLDGTTGALVSFPATSIIRNGGEDGSITSLQSDGELLYGSGYTFARNAGTLEGVFAAEWSTGNIRWVEDCHGDTYSIHPQGDVIYQAGHGHYCGNIGGFGQPATWEFYRGMAFSRAAAGVIATERLGYTNFAGTPRPELLNFFPTINAGTFTGLTQGPWSLAGNDRYILYGGEFTTVNGVAQQGLVRFQTRAFATNLQGPQLFNTTYPVKVQSLGAGTVSINFQANRDRDNATLEYRVYRRASGNTGNGTLRHTRGVTAPFFNRPVMTWTDSGVDVVPGTTYEYRVQVTDGFNSNFANSAWTPITVAGGAATPPYLAAVLASEPDTLLRLNEAPGATVAADLAGWRPAPVAPSATGVTFGEAGPSGIDGTAASFNGATGNFVRSEVHELPPHEMSLEAWFRAAPGANGGLIAGFNSSNTTGSGAGSGNSQDRTLYMDNTGRVHFGVNPTTPVTVSDGVDYRDDTWHHVVGTVGPSGLSIYVDGVLSGTDPTILWARTGYYGYLRVGGGAINGFPNTDTSTGRWFDGSIDEVALYKSTLTASEAEAHYEATGRTANIGNLAPTASFTTSMNPGDGVTASFDGSASTDTDGTIVNYSWNFGDGSPVVSGVSATTNHVFAEGTYTVALTVTDDDGATDQQAAQVIAPGANDAPVAAYSTQIVGRDVTVDATGSSDPDGSIVQYQWNFGDGSPVVTTASPTVTRTYSTMNTFTVTLTVTDDRGATAQRVQSLSTNNLPTPPPPGSSTVAADTFTRTVANGLGNADTGGTWTVSGGTAANYAVNGSTGRLTLGAPAASRSALLNGVITANVSALADVSFDKAATGGGTYASVIGRRVGTGEYRATVRAQANGTIQALLVRRIGTIDTNLAVAPTVPGLTHVAGQFYRVRFEVTGTNPTQLRMKVWAMGSPEPAAWLLTASDSTVAVQAAGSPGINTYLSGSATNAPVVTSIDNLIVIDPTIGTSTPPTARFAVRTTLLTATLDGSISVDDGTIAAWSWNFGDGTPSGTGSLVNHVYATPGTKVVTLTVTDNQGLTNQLTLNVTVNA